MKLYNKKFVIVILDDNEYFRMALKKQLLNTIEDLPLGKEYQFIFYVYDNPINFLSDLKEGFYSGLYVIAFIDYYIGKGINAKLVLKLINKYENGIKPIVLSQSSKVISNILNKHKHVDFIEKDTYSFTVCSLLFEQYIESKV